MGFIFQWYSCKQSFCIWFEGGVTHVAESSKVRVVDSRVGRFRKKEKLGKKERNARRRLCRSWPNFMRTVRVKRLEFVGVSQRAICSTRPALKRATSQTRRLGTRLGTRTPGTRNRYVWIGGSIAYIGGRTVTGNQHPIKIQDASKMALVTTERWSAGTLASSMAPFMIEIKAVCRLLDENTADEIKTKKVGQRF